MECATTCILFFSYCISKEKDVDVEGGEGKGRYGGGGW